MTYSCLAPFYDDIMWHVDYEDWAQLIKKVVTQYYKRKKISLFEIGGGTGTLGNILKTYKYNYQGSDLSYEMASIANSKNHSFICADALSLPIKSQFDMVIFLYDGINYVKTLPDYKKLFTNVFSILKPGGLFLFDITTETNSKQFFSDYHSCEEFGGSTIFRSSYYIETKKLQCNDFQIFTPLQNAKSLYIKQSEKHVQKLFTPTQICSVIPEKLFTTIGVWDGFSMLKYTKHSERIHFLLQKNDI